MLTAVVNPRTVLKIHLQDAGLVFVADYKTLQTCEPSI